MPRLYASNGDPVDLCQHHFPSNEEYARQKYGNIGDGPDERGNCFSYDDAHPNYGDDAYTCAVCGKRLSEERDGASSHRS